MENYLKPFCAYRYRHMWIKNWTFGTETLNKAMNNLPRHTAFYELVTSLLTRGIQMGDITKLRWLTGLVKHTIRAGSLYFMYLLLLSICTILSSSQMTL
jgi:hypothetical protein